MVAPGARGREGRGGAGRGGAEEGRGKRGQGLGVWQGSQVPCSWSHLSQLEGAVTQASCPGSARLCLLDVVALSLHLGPAVCARGQSRGGAWHVSRAPHAWRSRPLRELLIVAGFWTHVPNLASRPGQGAKAVLQNDPIIPHHISYAVSPQHGLSGREVWGKCDAFYASADRRTGLPCCNRQQPHGQGAVWAPHRRPPTLPCPLPDM
jgi:hypothetical protein